MQIIALYIFVAALEHLVLHLPFSHIIIFLRQTFVFAFTTLTQYATYSSPDSVCLRGWTPTVASAL